MSHPTHHPAERQFMKFNALPVELQSQILSHLFSPWSLRRVSRYHVSIRQSLRGRSFCVCEADRRDVVQIDMPLQLFLVTHQVRALALKQLLATFRGVLRLQCKTLRQHLTTLPNYVLSAITTLEVDLSIRRSGSWIELTHLLPRLSTLVLERHLGRGTREALPVLSCTQDIPTTITQHTVDQYRDTLRRWSKHFVTLRRRFPNIEIRCQYCLLIEPSWLHTDTAQAAYSHVAYRSNGRCEYWTSTETLSPGTEHPTTRRLVYFDETIEELENTSLLSEH